MILVALVAFLKGVISTQDLTMSIRIHTGHNQYRTGDHLMVDSDKEVDGIGHEIKVMVLELFFLPAFDLGIQLLGDSIDFRLS